MITFSRDTHTLTNVILDGKVVGYISNETEGYVYYTKGGKHKGEYFKSLADCKKSLLD